MKFNKTYFDKKFNLTVELPANENDYGYINVESDPSENFEYSESFTWYPLGETISQSLKDIEDYIGKTINELPEKI